MPPLPEQADDAIAAGEHRAGGKAAFFGCAGRWRGRGAIEQRCARRVSRQHRLDLPQERRVADAGALHERQAVARGLLERRLEDRPHPREPLRRHGSRVSCGRRIGGHGRHAADSVESCRLSETMTHSAHVATTATIATGSSPRVVYHVE